ncbi:MAG: citramalate synthase [Lentisphaeria bacterium]|nr:citramalate synthase [Lentisphaeria bacterium]
MEHVKIYDTTLRDGTQGESVNFSKIDKLRIAQKLDEYGVDYIEGGWPGSNPKDMGFFEEAQKLELKHAKIAAFGSTRRAKNTVENDPNIQTLLEANTPVCTIFGKTWLLHVLEVLRVTEQDNIDMIYDSVKYLRENGREVIYDAEHFFDGYKDSPEYALKTLQAAVDGGAAAVVLCDTNGGTLPTEATEICRNVKEMLPQNVDLGMHTHNDGSLAVANALAGVEAGARHVQGTINGVGERCGNVDLISVIANLQLKMKFNCIPDNKVSKLTELSRFIDDLANLDPNIRQPFVGQSAFAHKGGIHVNAVQKVAHSYEHIQPELVGNRQRILVSDLSGGSNILMKAAEHNIDIEGNSEEVRKILAELKRLESEGYEFEAAGASFELLMRKHLEKLDTSFQLNGFRVIVEKRGHHSPTLSEATVKVIVGGETEISAAEGDGPVNALDLALRKALSRFYPEISEMSLRDYKVRILDGESGTAAKTRVLITSMDNDSRWSTVGVSENLIEASWRALVDSVEYKLYKICNTK